MKVKLKKGLEMKKLSLVATAALVLAAASCKKGSDDGPSAVGGFRAHTESDGGKTELSDASVLWKNGDKIQVFSANGYAKYWPTTGTGTTSAYFEIVESSESGTYNEGETEHIAMYPCQDNITYNVEAKTITGFKLPNEQTYAENSFGNGAFPMFAYTDNTDLGFYNLCGVLRLSLYDLPWPVKTITVTSSNANEMLWGTGTVKVVGDDGKPHLIETETETGSVTLTDGDNTVVLNCGDNGVECNGGKAKPTYFHIVLPEGAFKNNGFKVEVECNNGYKKEVTCSRANEIVRSKVTCMPEKEFYCLDLGLPSGRLWAPCNLGVTPDGDGNMSKMAYGDYYAWGATKKIYESIDGDNKITFMDGYDGTIGFGWANPNCPYWEKTESSYQKFSKYVPSDKPEYWSGTDSPDNKLELDASDDVAAVLYGGAWRMPTREDFVELFNNCSNEGTTTEGGVYGWKFTSNNGKSIFLPAAGSCNETSHDGAGSFGNYWSRSLYSTTPYYAYLLYFNLNNVQSYNLNRYYGFTVRPVL